MKANSRKSTAHPMQIRQTIIISLCIVLALFIIAIAYVIVTEANAIAALQKLSNHDSGSTYDEVVTNIQAAMPNYEIIFVFDENNHKLIEYTNESPDYVGLPEEALALLKQFKNLKHFHTHPIHDNPHSDTDLSMLVRVGLDQSVSTLGVISTNYVYTLTCDDYTWPTDQEIWHYSRFLYTQFGYLEDDDLMQSIIINGEEYPYITTKFLKQLADDFGYIFQVQSTSKA